MRMGGPIKQVWIKVCSCGSFTSAALHNFSPPDSIRLSIGTSPGSCITPTILGVTSHFNKSIFFAARDSISVHCLGRMQDQVTHASTKVQHVKPRLSWLGHLDHSRTSGGAASNPSNTNIFQNWLLQDRRPFVYLRKVRIHARRSSGRLTGRRAAVRSFLGVSLHNFHSREAMHLVNVLHCSRKSTFDHMQFSEMSLQRSFRKWVFSELKASMS